ncbi:MAG: hypothetical protein Q7U39_00900 [Nitrospira sp.]|nr:hypothetical protein [Nitrospira sp.]
MRSLIASFVSGVALMGAVGCAGKGNIIPIQLQPAPLSAGHAAKPPDAVRVSVAPFEDQRQEKNRLGVRTHLWGGESVFNVPGGLPGEAAAQALADYLAARGWQVVKPGTADNHADVILSGRILDLAVDAKSGVGSTKLTGSSRLAVQARNTGDESQVRMTLSSAGSDRVFWFVPDDAQALLNDILNESFDKLMRDVKVEQRRLRLQ